MNKTNKVLKDLIRICKREGITGEGEEVKIGRKCYYIHYSFDEVKAVVKNEKNKVSVMRNV